MLSDVEVLDSKMASALNELLTAEFKKRVYMKEQKAQQDTRFLNGRQNAYMIGDNFKISGTSEALLDFNDQQGEHVKDDNLQGFDTKWDEVLLSLNDKSSG